MSGPKGGAYRVETAEQREARMLRDAKSHYARAGSAWQSAVSRMAALESLTGTAPSYQRPAAVAADADSAAYARAAEELEAAAAAAATAVTEAREHAARKSHAAHVARIVERLTSQPQPARDRARASKWQANRPTEGPTPAASVDWQRVKERIERRLAALTDLDHDPARVQQLLADISKAGSESRIDLLIRELDYLISDARTDAARRDAIAAAHSELVEMRAMLADLGGAEAKRLRHRITELIGAEAAAIPAGLREAVDAAVSSADAEADRRHVVGAMHSALQGLGYVVGPQFSTDLFGAQGAAFARSGSSGYGVKVRLEPGSTRFSAQVVKSDAALTTVEEDVAAERAFCGAFDAMVELTHHKGVELDVDIRTDPGACTVQKIADDRLARASAGGGARARKKMRRSR